MPEGDSGSGITTAPEDPALQGSLGCFLQGGQDLKLCHLILAPNPGLKPDSGDSDSQLYILEWNTVINVWCVTVIVCALDLVCSFSVCVTFYVYFSS